MALGWGSRRWHRLRLVVRSTGVERFVNICCALHGLNWAGMPNWHLYAAKVRQQLARNFPFGKATAANHQGWPGQAGHALGVAKQR